MPLDCPSPFTNVSALLNKGLQNIKSMQGKKVKGMYTLRPLLDLDTPVPLPSCMYSMTKLVGKSQNEKRQEDNSDRELATLQCQQDSIIEKLNSLKKQIDCLRSDLTEGCHQEKDTRSPVDGWPSLQEVVDIVVSAPPSQPPYSLLLVTYLLKDHYSVSTKCHIHSSVDSSVASPILLRFLKDSVHERSRSSVLFTLVWKNIEELEFVVDPMRHTKITGEANLCRYLARMIPSLGYEIGDPKKDTICDTVLDAVSKTLERGSSKEKQATIKMLDSRLGSAANIMGKDISVVDLYVWSVLHRGEPSKLPPSLSKWYTSICTRFDIN